MDSRERDRRYRVAKPSLLSYWNRKMGLEGEPNKPWLDKPTWTELYYSYSTLIVLQR